MRQAMIEQSCGSQGNLNCTGDSVGAFGDRKKLGGGRLPWSHDSWSNVSPSPLGGNQGQQGMFLGRTYAVGSVRDRLVESYAGSHDWLSSFRYGIRGDLIPYTRIGSALFTAYSAAAVLVATPFAVATAVPNAAFVPAVAGDHGQ
jgi:filamentous hemagglutinin